MSSNAFNSRAVFFLVLMPWVQAAQQIPADLTALPLQYVLLEDISGEMNLNQILNKSSRFKPPLNYSFNPGYSRSAFWFKASLNNPRSVPVTLWLEVGEPRLQSVRLFDRHQGLWRHRDAGTDIPAALHPVRAKTAVFPLEVPAGSEIQVYFRVQSITSIMVEPVLWQPLEFRAQEGLGLFQAGLLLGFFMIIAAYCLFLFLAFKDRSFLYHALSVIFFTLYESGMHGYNFLYLWPSSLHWATHSLSLFGQLSSLFFILFVRDFLKIRQLVPRCDELIRPMLFVLCGIILFSQFADYRLGTQTGLWFVFIVLPPAVFICYSAIKQSTGPIPYFMAGIFIMALGNVLKALDFLAIFPMSEWLGIHFMLPVMVCSMVFFLLAMLDRVLLVRKEKEQAQSDLLVAMSSQQQVLEKAVSLRTAELKAAVEEAESANQLKTTLLAHISHDLRAPLATIIGYARLMKNEAVTPDYPLVIERSATQQLQMIDELLQCARGELAADELILSEGCLAGFSEEMAACGLILARQYQNQFECLPLTPLPLRADWPRLRQVLQNLLANAAKFTRQGQITLSAEVSLTHSTARVSFAVTDTGQGMSAADIGRVLLPFERGQASQTEEGHGLGLAIASQWVRSMGGELQIESALHQGSRFYFELQLSRVLPRTGHRVLPDVSLTIPAGHLQALRAMVDLGQVSDIEDWVRQVKTEDPALTCFAEKIDLAVRRLDFNRLAELLKN